MAESVLFLDFDGVIVTRREIAQGLPHRPGMTQMMHLKRIVEETDCDIVISSSWRVLHPFEELQRILAQYGINSEKVIGITPKWYEVKSNIIGVHDCRGDEIRTWLEAHPEYTSFVILDDDTDMGELLDHLVHVKNGMEYGLQEEHVQAAVAILKRAEA